MKKLLWTVCLLGVLGLKVKYAETSSKNGHGVLENLESLKNLENYDYKKYHSIEEIYTWMSQIKEKYNDVVTWHSLGKTYEDQLIYYLKISEATSKDHSKEKIIWMDCGIHAREWITPAFCQWFVKEILQNYKTDSRISRFLKKLDFYILPVFNIDGYVYTWTTERLWRKSRSSVNNGTCFGTDLNRNFNISWCSVGASANCKSSEFCGTGIVSEPEVKAVSSFIESKKDSILCMLSMHSYGQFILTPFGYTLKRPRNHDELIHIGQKAAKELKAKHGTNYRVGSTSEMLYLTSGSLQDWAYDLGIPFTYTFELRDNGTYKFLLPEEQIQPTCEETMAAVLSIVDDIYKKKWGSNRAVVLTLTTLGLSISLSFMLFL